MIRHELFTAQVDRELLDYDPETGVLTWRYRASHWFAKQQHANMWNARYAGAPAGTPDAKGYLRVTFYNKRFLAYRAIWLIMTGEWPQGDIDHIDHDPSNNRWENLRVVSGAENNRNQPRHCTNTSGATGVSWHSIGKKWKVSVGEKYIGLFEDFDAAVAAQRKAAALAGYHPNHGAPPK